MNCQSAYLFPANESDWFWRLNMVDFFVVELEFGVNDSFFGGTLFIFEIENDRLFGIPVDIEAGRLNIVLVVVELSVEFGVRRTVFTGVFVFYLDF